MRIMRILAVLLPATGVALLAQTNDLEPATPNHDAAATNSSAAARTNAWEYTLPQPGAVTTNALPAAQTNAPAPNVRQLSLQDCIQLALQHNLDLQIDRYNPQIALFSLNAAYGGYDPSFVFSGQHDRSETAPTVFGTNIFAGQVSDDNSFNSSLGGLSPWGTTYSLQGNAIDSYGNFPEYSSGSASITVRQSLLKNLWIDSTRLTIRIGKNRVKYSELGLKWQIMQTVTTLEQAYYDLIYDRENLIVQQKAVQLAERLVAENRKKLEVGALAPLDLESAEAQAAQSQAAVIAAQSQLGTQERLVKKFITDNFAAWADIVLEPSGKLEATHQIFNRQDSWSKGLTQRPDLLQAKLDVEKQGIQLKFDRNQLFPQLDLFGTYGYNGQGKEFSDALYDIQQMDQRFYTYGGQITIPLANISARNTYKSSKATLQQLLLTLKQAEQNVMITIDNDIGTIQANYEQVLATRAARQYAEAALNAEELKLQNGKSTVYTVLQMQRDLTTARGNEIQALDTHDKSVAQLSLDEGSTLDRLKIDWHVE